MKQDNIIDFIYPYVLGEDKFEELRYSLRSLEKHYADPFRVVIVGDKPEWCQNVIHVPVERQTGMKENLTYDAVWKLITICKSDMISGIFVRMYDDIYLLRNMDFKFLSLMKANYNATDRMNRTDGTQSDVWLGQLHRTYTTLLESGQKTIWNFETHLPEVFLKSIVLWILEKYNVLEQRLLITTLYNNICWQEGDQEPWLVDIKTNIKAGFYGSNTNYSHKSSDAGNIRSILKGKYFLNHNDEGLNPGLIEVIKELFPNKSSFEK
jgi:hypothetical protein